MGTKTGIYKLTNPEGKSYIGQATDIERRHQMYKQLNKDSIGPKFLSSLIKYSYYNHKMEILEECSLDQLDEKEFFWKKKFIYENGWNNALFCRLKDKKGGKHSLESIKKMSKAKIEKNIQRNLNKKCANLNLKNIKIIFLKVKWGKKI